MLIFPRTRPTGANSVTGRQAIGADAAFPTQVIDYMKFKVIPAGGKGTGNTIYLYLPPKLSEKFNAKYNGVELGAVGAAAVQAFKNVGPEGIGDGFGEQVKAMAQGAKPALGYSIGSEVINKVVGMTGGSGNLTPGNLSALTKGRIFNPYEETIFQGSEFRDHTFNFKLVPKNATDVKAIYDIIQAFRIAMLPEEDGKHWLTVPDKFRIELVRYSGGALGETITTPSKNLSTLSKLMRFPHDLVLHDMQVDYSPDGNYAGLQAATGNTSIDYGPVSYDLTLSFKETKYLLKKHYKDK